MPTENLLKYLIIPVLAFATTYALTPHVIHLAARLGMMDEPDERRIHERPVPRAGGLALFAGFHAACAAIFLLPWHSFSGLITKGTWLHILGLTSILLLVGLRDDRYGMPALVKLGAQILVGCLAYGLKLRLGAFFGISLPMWLDLPCTVFWFVAFINAFNLIDGMDGLATGLAAIAALGLAGVFLIGRRSGDCLVMLALLGACAGFLRFNFNPARIFLGDTGSMFLGCTLAALALNTSTKSTTVTALAVPFLAVGVPMFDTFLAVWRRLARKFLRKDGGDVFGADIDHLHHRLLKAGLSQRRAASLLYAGSFALVGVALLAMLFSSSAVGIYMIAFVVGGYIIVQHVAKVEMWTTGMALMHGLRQPRLKHLTVPLYIVCDLVVLMAANLGAHLLLEPGAATLSRLQTILLEQAPLVVGIPFVCMTVGGRVYKRVWHLASSMDFTALAVWTIMGIVFGSGVSLALGIQPYPEAGMLRATVVYIGLALVPLLCLHAFMRLLTDALGTMQIQGKGSQARMPVLVFGATHHGKLFLRDQKSHSLKGDALMRIMGFLDDDSNLHGRLIHGLEVFGGMDQLEETIKKTSAQLIVVTAELSPEGWQRLEQIAGTAGIAVAEWQPVFRNVAPKAPEETVEEDNLNIWLPANALQMHIASKINPAFLPSGGKAKHKHPGRDYRDRVLAKTENC